MCGGGGSHGWVIIHIDYVHDMQQPPVYMALAIALSPHTNQFSTLLAGAAAGTSNRMAAGTAYILNMLHINLLMVPPK